MVALTGIYVVATIFISVFNYRTAKATKEQITEIKRQYETENRPYITTEFVYLRRAFYVLRFTNHGKRIATHVKILFDQAFLDSILEPSFRGMLENQKGRECIIGIEKQHELFIGSNKYTNNPHKIPISGQVVYSDGDNNYTNEFCIDAGKYSTFFSINTDTDDILAALKSQTEQLKKIGNILESVSLLSNVSANIQNPETESDEPESQEGIPE